MRRGERFERRGAPWLCLCSPPPPYFRTQSTKHSYTMKIDSLHILAELERLAQGAPWDAVDIWITRQPEGELSFSAYVRENNKLGFASVWSGGSTPTEAVSDALTQCAKRDPEIARKQKIAEHEEAIRKLRAVQIGLPPYRPNRELANGTATVPDPIVEV